MILDDKVLINITNRNKQYYSNLGYDVSEKQIYVSPFDLPNGSKIKIHVKCDNDGTDSWQQKSNYMKITNNNTEPYYCKNCATIKQKKTMMEKYGIEHCSQIDEVKEKKRIASQKKYGCDNVFQAQEVKDKIVKTNLERYGHSCPLLNEEVKEKSISTCLEKYGDVVPMRTKQIKDKLAQSMMDKYGFQNAMQCPEIREKIENTNMEKYNAKTPVANKEVRQKITKTLIATLGTKTPFESEKIHEKIHKTFIENYGVENPMQIPNVKKKAHQTMYKNGTCPTSTQQRYIANLYSGLLNYPCHHYSLDIYLLDEKIDVEIDFGGHDLSVKLGNISPQEFLRKQIIRDTYAKQDGIKIMRIISQKDWCPSDSVLLSMLDYARAYFGSPTEKSQHSWCTFNIDESKIYNAEHKDGESYDFGELRKIKASDIESQTA